MLMHGLTFDGGWKSVCERDEPVDVPANHVLDPGLDNGFFYSRIVYAAQARSLYVTKWQNVQPLGESYALLADAAAGLDQDARIAWSEAQAASLDNLTWKRDQVKDTLSSLTKESVTA